MSTEPYELPPVTVKHMWALGYRLVKQADLRRLGRLRTAKTGWGVTGDRYVEVAEGRRISDAVELLHYLHEEVKS